MLITSPEQLNAQDTECEPLASNVATLPTFTPALPPAEPVMASFRVPPSRMWTLVLLETLVDPSIVPGKAKIITTWGSDLDEVNPPQHGAYRAHVLETISVQMPWLLPLLDHANALVAISPGSFFFVVPKYLGRCFVIDELSRFTHLVPWTTEDDLKAVH